MWRSFCLSILLWCHSSNAQTISTVAGNGSTSYIGDGGSATSAGIGYAGTIIFDRYDNYYFSELNNTIRKVSSSGIISTVAGNGTTGYSGDGGPATAAQFDFTGGGGVIFDNANNLYIADQANNRIRKIAASTGIVTTVIGTGVAGFSGDGGMASSAKLNAPAYMAIDEYGSIYILDAANYRIRKVTASGIITTIAGNGTMGFSGDGGAATAAEISPGGLIIIGNNHDLYLADGIRVRKIDLLTSIITTIAGNGISGYSGDGGAATSAQFMSALGLAIDLTNNIFVSDNNSHRVRKINSSGVIYTVAGNGGTGFSGDGGLATLAEIYSPRGIAVDICGNLFIVDNGNKRIRKVTFNPPPCTYLSVDEQVVKKEVSIYPNPANEVLHIEASPGLPTSTIAQCRLGEVMLCNMLGQVVLTEQLNSNHSTITIKHLPPGLYLLALTGEDGKRTVHKIVKE